MIRMMIASVVVIAVGLASAVVVTIVVTVVAATTGAGWIALLIVWAVLGAATSLVNTPSSRLLACFLITYPIAGCVGAISLTFAAATPAGVGVLVLSPQSP